MPSLTRVTDHGYARAKTGPRDVVAGRVGTYLKCTPSPHGSDVMATLPGENAYRVGWSLASCHRRKWSRHLPPEAGRAGL